MLGEGGATWPNQTATAAQKRESETVTEEDRQWWAFRSIVRPNIASESGINPIDAVMQSPLASKGLKPSPPAKRQQLIRRVHFDLIGLPPTYDAVRTFVKSNNEVAFDAVVDDLLIRPEFRERWARHWLDVVRFTQTNGYERDDEKPQA